MRSDSAWMSEAVLYGFMILNIIVVSIALLWSWSRGHLKDLEDANDILFADEEHDHD